MSTMKLTLDSWKKIKKDLLKTHPQKTFMLKANMKSILGFIVRYSNPNHEVFINLDFFDERKRTLFLMQYSDMIEYPKTTQHNPL